MLDDKDITHIISWNQNGDAWKIHDPTLFTDEVVPKYFTKCKYSSFLRMACGWGFKRVLDLSSDHGCYSSPHFSREHPELIKNMKREQPVKTVSNIGDRILNGAKGLTLLSANAPLNAADKSAAAHIIGRPRNSGSYLSSVPSINQQQRYHDFHAHPTYATHNYQPPSIQGMQQQTHWLQQQPSGLHSQAPQWSSVHHQPQQASHQMMTNQNASYGMAAPSMSHYHHPRYSHYEQYGGINPYHVVSNVEKPFVDQVSGGVEGTTVIEHEMMMPPQTRRLPPPQQQQQLRGSGTASVSTVVTN